MRSFDQLNISNHSLPAWGTDPAFSHKSNITVQLRMSRIIIIKCSYKTLIYRQFFAGQVVSSWPMKREEKIYRVIIIIKIIVVLSVAQIER